jgi:penicillin-binding protein 2
MKPHLVKIIENGVTHERTLTVPKESYRIALKQENIDFIRAAMVGVTTEPGGTGLRVFSGADYVSGGKTGTAQVVGLKKNEKGRSVYDSKTMAERHRDHSLYIAFAPADKPRIALALVVENGGFGAEAAAPIARKAFDYYLLGKRPIDKDKPPVEKTDATTIDSEANLKAESEAAGGPKPGAETQGNTD